MLLEGKIRRFSGAVFGVHIAISALAVGAFIPTSAAAQTGEPLKIGYSMALSGGLGPNGRSALLAQKIYAELAQTNPHFKKMLDSLTAYRSDSYQWLQVAELSYDTFMMRMRTRA